MLIAFSFYQPQSDSSLNASDAFDGVRLVERELDQREYREPTEILLKYLRS